MVRRRNVNYETYSRLYDIAASKHEMFEEKWNKAEYRAAYAMQKREFQRAGVNRHDIPEVLVKRQEYETTWKQAKAIRQAQKSLGLKPSKMKQLQEEGAGKEFFDELRDRWKELSEKDRKALEESGVTSYKEWVSYIFGSL